MNSWKKIGSNSLLSILIVGLISVILITQFSWKGNDNKGFSRVISSDGVGYYYYLPNTLLSKTIGSQTPDRRFFNKINDKGVNKYYVGTAVSMAPFFLVGHMIAIANGDELTGFSPAYHKAISFAGLFYLLGGLLFIRAFFRLYKFEEWIITSTLLILFFGTNLMAYALLMPSMSHIYSFFFVSGFLYFAKKYCKKDLNLVSKNKFLFLGIAFFAMVVLIRPLNGIIIFALPFLAESWGETKRVFTSLFIPKRIIIGSVIIFTFLFIQSYFWYLQCNEWVVWSYGNEGFYFLKPYIKEVLFSFRKGAFIYTPVLVVSVIGLIVLIKRNKFQGWSLFLFFALLVYLISSWWNWYYGPSFGQRPFVEFYGLSALLIAFALQFISKKRNKIVLISFIAVCVFVNLIQTYQYHSAIISSWDMNYNKYAYTFLRTGEEYKNCLGGNNDLLPYKPKKNVVFEESYDFESIINGLEFGNTKKEETEHKTVLDYSDTEFNLALTIPVNKEFVTEKGVYIIANMKKKDLEISRLNEALLVIEISDAEGNKYRYGTIPINDIPPVVTNKWLRHEFSIEIQEVRNATDIIKIYIWNKEKQPFLVDDFNIAIWAIE